MLKAGQSLDNKASGNNGRIAEGIYGKKGVITKVVQHTDKKLGNYEPDVFIEFTIKSGAYENSVTIFGHFNRDQMTQKIISWGLAGKIDQAFNRLGGYDGLSEEEKQMNGVMFSEAVLNNLIGKPVYFLSYVYGRQRNADKPAYRNYSYLLPVNEEQSDEDHYNLIYDVLQGDAYTMKQLAEGRAYLQESSERYKASQQSSNTSSTANAAELVYGKVSSTNNVTVSDDDLMF